FFQAEDGIRDFHVTGVQTCALPICKRRSGQACPRWVQRKPRIPYDLSSSPWATVGYSGALATCLALAVRQELREGRDRVRKRIADRKSVVQGQRDEHRDRQRLRDTY